MYLVKIYSRKLYAITMHTVSMYSGTINQVIIIRYKSICNNEYNCNVFQNIAFWNSATKYSAKIVFFGKVFWNNLSFNNVFSNNILPSSAQAPASQSPAGGWDSLIIPTAGNHPTRHPTTPYTQPGIVVWPASSIIITTDGTCSCLVHDLFMTCSWILLI